MYRSKFRRMGAPVAGALGVFVCVCALGATAEAFDAPTPATQPQEVEQSLESEAGSAVGTVAVLQPAEPTRSAMGPALCESVVPPDWNDAQIGIQGFELQEFHAADDCWDLDGNDTCDLGTEDIDGDGDCDIADCGWAGLAFPIIVEGTSVDTISFQLNSNFSGGDIYLTGGAGGDDPCGSCPHDLGPPGPNGNVGPEDLGFLLGCWGPVTPGDACECLDIGPPGPNANIGPEDLGELLGSWGECPAPFGGDTCQPNIFDMRRKLGCAVSGLERDVVHDLHFDPITTTPGETIWAIFVGRSGESGQDLLQVYDGSTFPAHQVARSDVIPSEPGNSFANTVDTGNIGDWDDLHGLGDALGTFYYVSLSAMGQDPDTFDCVANPDPVGSCCNIGGGAACEEMRGFECGAADGVYLGDGTTCADCNTACNADAGDCCAANGTPGCEDSDCCHYVCELAPFCCTDNDGEGWDSICQGAALDQEFGCGQLGETCEPTQCVEESAGASYTCIKSDSNFSNDGSAGFVLDEFGSWTSITFGGGNKECDYGDKFKPVGFPAAEGVFANATFLYIDRGDPDLNQRAVLSLLEDYTPLYPIVLGEAALFPEVPAAGTSQAFDTNDDGLVDRLESSFVTCYAGTQTFLEWDVVQTVEKVVSGGGQGVAVLTLVYNITNTSPLPIDFNINRQVDSDLLWITNDYEDDVVGTMTHAAGGDLSVYTMEAGRPQTAVTLSSPQATSYWGAKGGADPDGSGTCDAGICNGGPHAGEVCNPLDCPGEDCLCEGGPLMGCGTDLQEWDAFGVPEGWANHIAFVGTDIDGESEAFPEGCGGGCGCDGHIGIGMDLHLEPAASTCICIQFTYGQRTPWMGGTCPEECSAP